MNVGHRRHKTNHNDNEACVRKQRTSPTIIIMRFWKEIFWIYVYKIISMKWLPLLSVLNGFLRVGKSAISHTLRSDGQSTKVTVLWFALLLNLCMMICQTLVRAWPFIVEVWSFSWQISSSSSWVPEIIRILQLYYRIIHMGMFASQWWSSLWEKFISELRGVIWELSYMQ